MTRQGHRIATLAGLFALAAAGCKLELDPAPPVVGPPVGSRPPPAGLVVTLEGAGVGGDGSVWVEVTVTKDDLPLDGAALAELRPAFTLAALGEEPVTGFPAWRSLLPTGRQLVASLPVAGPGTPEGEATVLTDDPQPGAEEAQPEDLGGGRFRHVFQAVPPAGFLASETLRVGVFMEAVSGNPRACGTLDFVPAGGTPERREVVADAACARCHDFPRAHGGTRIGTRLCVTCHTYQLADPDTVDPAAAITATPLTNPNPLELGRLLHRVHRGRNLPTLYQAKSSDPAPALPSATPLPLPFLPGRNTLAEGRKFSVVGEGAEERVFGEARRRSDGGGPSRLVASGIWFPRTFRECDACHAGAADAPAAHAGWISRRTCQGCHPDVWFQPVLEPLDGVHLAHPGGPQADDSRCGECHVRSATVPQPLAPLDEVHVAPLDRLAASEPVLEIVELRDFQPGLQPTVVFTVRDRTGAITSLGAPEPAMEEPSRFPDASPVPRAMWSSGTNSTISILIGGPAAGGGPEYVFRSVADHAFPLSETVPVATAADLQGRFAYTFTKPLPAWATGTWSAVISGRRGVATVHYDAAGNRFAWPYTGESVYETAMQAIAHVDVATGRWAAGEPAPPGARRVVVEQARCEACHRRLAFHGGTRNLVQGCLLCHTPERTDWARRPKDTGGNVNLAATYDGLEEQSVHFKVMIERIHTGSRPGTSATIEQFDPYVIYGYGGNPYFFADGTFPADLAACHRCHGDGTWRLDTLVEGAGATIANETRSIAHAGTIEHDRDPGVGPMQASCTSCHANAFATSHAERNTIGGRETCVSCHGVNGQKASDKVHGL